jgi:hypothetical protein
MPDRMPPGGRTSLSIAGGVCLLLLAWTSGALAQQRLASSESMRPVVSPALIWRFDAGMSVTTLASGPALITLPQLGATVGVPGIGIPWRGLELSANVVDFVVSPAPPAFGWIPRFALTQRLLPTPGYPVTGEIRNAIELALRLQMGVDPIVGKPFRIEGSIPIVFRAAPWLRVDVSPGLGYQAVYDRAVLAAPLRLLLQPFDRFYIAAVSGITIPDLRYAKTAAVPLGGQLGLTVAGDFGPLLDLIVEAGFPQLFIPAQDHSTVHTEQFRVMASIRLFTFWDLDATDPDQNSGADSRRRRCGGGS